MSGTLQGSISGGTQLAAKLHAMAARAGTGRAVRVGFLQDATYPGNDGGARLRRAAKRAQKGGQKNLAGLLSAWGDWEKTHNPTIFVAQVAMWQEFGTSTTAPRPFFRTMIHREQATWGPKLGEYLKTSGYDGNKAFMLLGEDIKDALVTSIQTWPADNKPLTAFIKQFNKGLVDHSVMVRSVDYEVMK